MARATAEADADGASEDGLVLSERGAPLSLPVGADESAEFETTGGVAVATVAKDVAPLLKGDSIGDESCVCFASD